MSLHHLARLGDALLNKDYLVYSALTISSLVGGLIQVP